ncbi:MAG: P1 family peptidase [Thermoplasmata archaeon]|nr:P1 family peptidase [Thermoplasmata archaeon]
MGSAESSDHTTGVTVVLFEDGAPTVVDVRGGASGTFDTASLGLDATFGRRWALFLAGGSLFGLDAARGIRRRVLETGGGVEPFPGASSIVPISGAILFDLPKDPRRVPDYAEIGYRAALGASRAPVQPGPFGAGAGATIGKYLGRIRAAPGGIGSAATNLPGVGRVGVLVAVNAVGAIRDPATGEWLAGPRGRDGRVVPPVSLKTGPIAQTRGTSLVIVVTDARVERSVLQRLAIFAHAGLARAVDPSHTSTDGDVAFVATTGAGPKRLKEGFPGATADRLGAATAALVVRSVHLAARSSDPRASSARDASGSRAGS